MASQEEIDPSATTNPALHARLTALEATETKGHQLARQQLAQQRKMKCKQTAHDQRGGIWCGQLNYRQAKSLYWRSGLARLEHRVAILCWSLQPKQKRVDAQSGGNRRPPAECCAHAGPKAPFYSVVSHTDHECRETTLIR
eukprot:4594967-Amphidinium_carterae.1